MVIYGIGTGMSGTCIDECIFGMSHSFQYIMVNVLSKSVVSLSYTRSNTLVIVS